MSVKPLQLQFYKAAALSLIGISLALTATGTEREAPLPPLAAPQDHLPPKPPPAFDGTLVTWGDSIGNGLGLGVAPGNAKAHVINRGKDGSGFLVTDNKPKPLDHIPRGAVVMMSIGTNDVGALLESSPKGIKSYAARVVGAARDVKAQGATPIVIGMQAPLGPYTGNPKLWNKPGFYEHWVKTMRAVNTEISAAAHEAGILYSAVQNRVGERAADRLHYTKEGSVHIANNALTDAGVTARFAPPPPK